MKYIDQETKKVIVQKALNREKGKPLAKVAEENNISLSALAKWLRQARESGKNALNQQITHRTPLEHLLMTANLEEEKIGVYCREQGIHSFQLKEWSNQLMNFKENKTTTKERLEIKELKAENKRLKKDLSLKEKALAEASALLVLKKKASSIWGGLEAN